MIEEAHVPEWMLVPARMTRRRLRLASSTGYPLRQTFPGSRHRIAEFLMPPADEMLQADAEADPGAGAVSPEIQVGWDGDAELLNDSESFSVPAHWAERAVAEAESQQVGEVGDRIEPPSEAAATTSSVVSETQGAVLEAVERAVEGLPPGQSRLASPNEPPLSGSGPAESLKLAARSNEITLGLLPVAAAVPAETEDNPAPPGAQNHRRDACATVRSNRIGLDFRRPMPRPKVNGFVVDFHCRLLAAGHAPAWFEAADHYGIDCFVTMTALEEAAALQREWGGRLHFVAVPSCDKGSAALSPAQWVDDLLVRLEAFYNLGSRMVNLHAGPAAAAIRETRLDSPLYRPLFREIAARKMAVIADIGGPELRDRGQYSPAPKAIAFERAASVSESVESLPDGRGSSGLAKRDCPDPAPELTAGVGAPDDHCRMWEGLLEEYPATPWVGVHPGGSPQDPGRLQGLLDRHPNLWLDTSAAGCMARGAWQRRDVVREFLIRNRERLLFGSGQISADDRGFDFYASRFWAQRKLWETAYAGPGPIADPELPAEQEPMLRGLALPDQVLQDLYHDNAVRFLAQVGAGFGGWG